MGKELKGRIVWIVALGLLGLAIDIFAEEANTVSNETVVAEQPPMPEADAGLAPIGRLDAEDPVVPEEDFSKLSAAVQWHYELAKQGDREAQYNLGSVYETGFGVKADAKKAIFWLTKAADQGHVPAQVKLGLMTMLGIGTPASLIKGRKWISAAAGKGDSLAKLLMEKVLAPEAQPLVDVKVLTDKIYRALATGELNAEETLRIAIHRVERDRETEPEKERFAGQVTGSGAKPGTVRNQLPDFLDKDSQDRSTLGHSVSLVRRHAKDGVADAQYEWAQMLETGQGVLVNKPEAAKWYSAAAAQGYADAQYRLGIAYLYGLGVDRDNAKAALWLKRASDQKQPAAVLMRAMIGDKPGLQGFDVSFALSVYLERSLQGDGDAMLALGHMCEFGWGVPQDDEKAQRWYAKARAEGVKDAAGRLSRMQTAGAVQRGDNEPDLAATTSAITASSNSKMTGTIQRDVSASQGSAIPRDSLPALPSSTAIPSTQLDPLSREGRAILLQRYGLPILLILLGLIMGWAVFRLLRRGVGTGEVL